MGLYFHACMWFFFLHYLAYGTIPTLLKTQHITSVSTYLKFYLDEKSHMQIFQYYNETYGGRNLTTSLLLSAAKEISKPPFLAPEVQ